MGKLGEAMTQEVFDYLQAARSPQAESRPYVAVASAEGMLVNLHLGEADELLIFDATRPTSRNPARAPRGTWLAAMARNGSAAERLSGRVASGAGRLQVGS